MSRESLRSCPPHSIFPGQSPLLSQFSTGCRVELQPSCASPPPAGTCRLYCHQHCARNAKASKDWPGQNLYEGAVPAMESSSCSPGTSAFTERWGASPQVSQSGLHRQASLSIPFIINSSPCDPPSPSPTSKWGGGQASHQFCSFQWSHIPKTFRGSPTSYKTPSQHLHLCLSLSPISTNLEA